MKRIWLPLSIFLAYLTVVGIGTGTPRYSLYFRIANSTFLLIHLAFVAFMSVLVVRERWGDPCRLSSGPTMLQRVRAWITDDNTFRRRVLVHPGKRKRNRGYYGRGCPPHVICQDPYFLL